MEDNKLTLFESGDVKTLYYNEIAVCQVDKNDLSKCFVEPEYLGYRQMSGKECRNINTRFYTHSKPLTKLRPIFFYRSSMRKFFTEDSIYGRYVIRDIIKDGDNIFFKGYYIYKNSLKGVKLLLKPLKYVKPILKGKQDEIDLLRF